MWVLLMATERAIHIMPTLNFFQRFLNYSHCTKSIQLCWVTFHTQLKRFMNWVDRRPNLFWFLCTLFDPVQPHQFSFNKAKKILKSCVALIHLIVGCTPTRWKIFRFLSAWLPSRGAQFFPGFSLISLILSNIFTPLEKIRREWIS